jgi:cytochrome oxidase Cu insertion factor (SCO1/SenC/PrrC family)
MRDAAYTPRPRRRAASILWVATLVASLAACTPITERGASTGEHRPPDEAGEAEQLEIGARVPDFGLRDPSGALVRSSAWRGKVVVLTFFETRSPEPSLCPEVIDRLAELRDMLLPRWAAEVHTVAASVDPAHDSGETLRAWMGTRGIGDDGFWTVGGVDPDELENVLADFGVFVWTRGDGSVGHTLNTVVIDRRGRLADRFPGTSNWSTEDLLAAVTAVAGR